MAQHLCNYTPVSWQSHGTSTILMVFTRIWGIFYGYFSLPERSTRLLVNMDPLLTYLLDPFGAVTSTLTLVYIYWAFTSLGEDTVLKQMMQLLKGCLVSSYDEPTHFESWVGCLIHLFSSCKMFLLPIKLRKYPQMLPNVPKFNERKRLTSVLSWGVFS